MMQELHTHAHCAQLRLLMRKLQFKLLISIMLENINFRTSFSQSLNTGSSFEILTHSDSIMAGETTLCDVVCTVTCSSF